LLGNGDGTFQPAIATNSGAGFTALVVADFNGDGKLDVAGMVPGVGLLVFLGQGNGMFAPGVVNALMTVSRPSGAGNGSPSMMSGSSSHPAPFSLSWPMSEWHLDGFQQVNASISGRRKQSRT
jgi:hypothetical protein